MSEKIIIDGVDVSKCPHFVRRYMEDYDIDTLNYCGQHYKPCEKVDIKYCFFKQLQRKTAECEKYEQALLRIRRLELEELDIDFDEYITHVREADYSPILTEVAKVLGDIEND